MSITNTFRILNNYCITKFFRKYTTKKYICYHIDGSCNKNSHYVCPFCKGTKYIACIVCKDNKQIYNEKIYECNRCINGDIECNFCNGSGLTNIKFD